MESTASATTQLKKFMFVTLGQAQFALPLSSVREVLGLGTLTAVPNMPAYFAGLLNLRGKIVSAVHLKKSLNFLEGTQSSVQKRACVIITEQGGRMYGAIVDDVSEVHAVPAAEIESSVESLAHREMFEGVVKKSDQSLAPILNLNKALRIEELLKVAS